MRSKCYVFVGVFAFAVFIELFCGLSRTQAQSGSETTVMVMPFSGPKSKRARRAVKLALEEEGYDIVSFADLEDKSESLGIASDDTGEMSTLSGSLGASSAVSGRVRKRGKRWSAEIEVYGNDGDSLGNWNTSARSHHKLYKKIENGFWKNLGSAVEQAISVSTVPSGDAVSPEDAVSPKGGGAPASDDMDVEGASQGTEQGRSDDEKPPALRKSPVVYVPETKLRKLELQVLVGSYTRKLGYNRGAVPAAENYNLPLSAAAHARLAWYPFAGITKNFFGHVGLDLRGHMPFVFQAQDSLGNEFGSFSYEGSAGLRFRIPIGKSEIAFVGGAGVHSFLFGDPDDESEAAFPSNQYVFGRVALESRWQLGRIVSLHADFAWLPVFAEGEITGPPFVVDGEVGGFEAEGALGFALTKRLELLLSFWMRQFSISEGGGLGNPFVADAAADRYFGGLVGLGVTLPQI